MFDVEPTREAQRPIAERPTFEGLRVRPVSRAEYDRMVEAGFFADEHVELIRGVIVEMSPQGSPHGVVVTRLTMLLVPALAGRALVRVQLPLAVSHDSEPEPDLAVVAPWPEEGPEEHPRTALLVIEVAQSSLREDRLLKAALYAAAGVPEFWIVNIPARTVEVHTDPDAPGGRYRTLRTAAEDQVLRPAAFPDLAVVLADILPRIAHR